MAQDNQGTLTGRAWQCISKISAVIATAVALIYLYADFSLNGALISVIMWFGSYLFSAILMQIPLLIWDSGKTLSEGRKSAFAKFSFFAIGVLFAIALFDVILLQGDFLVFPLLSILTTGTMTETFWGCDGTWMFEARNCQVSP